MDLLGRPAYSGRRRIPGFRPRDPRLAAMALALLECGSSFRTRDLAPRVARLLTCTPSAYAVRHARYDLSKLRARWLVERLGKSVRYQLTGIGRKVCQAVAESPLAVNLTAVEAAQALPGRLRARSA
jgi:hypothetical protein